MNNYVKYALCGFSAYNGDSKEWEINLQDNREHIYQDHAFLYSAFIGDHLESIVLRLLPNIRCIDYLEELDREVDKICFNIISHAVELSDVTPFWYLDLYIDENGQDRTLSLQERIGLCEKTFAIKNFSAKSIYDAAFGNENALESHTPQYKELLYVLQNPNRVVQYIGLYDIMANLIYTSGENKDKKRPSQKMVVSFFDKNKSEYGNRVQIIAGSKPVVKKGGRIEYEDEDTLTQLRSQIAHAKDRGIEKFLEVSKSISFEQIQTLLIVINDLLCGAVTT